MVTVALVTGCGRLVPPRAARPVKEAELLDTDVWISMGKK